MPYLPCLAPPSRASPCHACHAVPSRALPRPAVPRLATPAMPCRAVPRRARPYPATPRLPCLATPIRAKPCLPCQARPCQARPCRAVPCQASPATPRRSCLETKYYFVARSKRPQPRALDFSGLPSQIPTPQPAWSMSAMSCSVLTIRALYSTRICNCHSGYSGR